MDNIIGKVFSAKDIVCGVKNGQIYEINKNELIIVLCVVSKTKTATWYKILHNGELSYLWIPIFEQFDLFLQKVEEQ